MTSKTFIISFDNESLISKEDASSILTNIDCNKKDVIKVEFNECIIGYLPKLSEFENLTNIDFVDCVFTRSNLLNSLGYIKKLKQLWINNCINGVYIPDSLFKLDNFTNLGIVDTQIWNNGYKFNNLRHLENLRLVDNKNYFLNQNRSPYYFNSPNLKKLHITHNPTEFIGFTSECGVQDICLSDNRINKLQDNILQLKNLEELFVEDNNISDLSNLKTDSLNREICFCFSQNPIKSSIKHLIHENLVCILVINSLKKENIKVTYCEAISKAREEAKKEIALGIQVDNNKEFINTVKYIPHGVFNYD